MSSSNAKFNKAFEALGDVSGLDDTETQATASSSDNSSLTSQKTSVETRLQRSEILGTIPPFKLSCENEKSFILTQKNTGPHLALIHQWLDRKSNLALARTCKTTQPFFTHLTHRQFLLNATAKANLQKIKLVLRKILEKSVRENQEPNFEICFSTGTAMSSCGDTYHGSALQMAKGARDTAIYRKDCISPDRCDFLPMADEPTEDNLPHQADLPEGQLRTYVYVTRNGQAKLYFVERLKADAGLLIDEIKPETFIAGRNMGTLLAELLTNGLSQIIMLSPEQLSIVTKHTDHTFEEDAEKTMERYIRISPEFAARIPYEEAKQFPSDWRVHHQMRVTEDSKALNDLMNVLIVTSKKECVAVDKIDIEICKILARWAENLFPLKTIIRRQIPHQSEEKYQELVNKRVDDLKEIIRRIHKAPNEKTFDAAYQELINFLEQNQIANDLKLDPGFIHSPLLKETFKFRNHLEPRGIKKTGIYFNYDLLDEVAKLYEKYYPIFGEDHPNKNTPYLAPRNLFMYQKMIGYILTKATDADAYLVWKLYSILEYGSKLGRDQSQFSVAGSGGFFDGYNCCGGRLGRVVDGREWFLQNFCRAKTSPERLNLQLDSDHKTGLTY